MRYLLILLLFLSVTNYLHAGQIRSIPLLVSSAKTFYIEAAIGDLSSSKFMLDTGSGYTTINQASFDALKKQNKLQFVKKVAGILADGSQRIVEIWQVESLTLNGICKLKNIQVAFMPSTNRQILGLTTLTKLAPFTVSLNPPQLTLSNCA